MKPKLEEERDEIFDTLDMLNSENRIEYSDYSRLYDDSVNLANDRNKWRNRAKAWERAVKNDCNYCIYSLDFPSGCRVNRWDCLKTHENWLFDEARFAKGDVAE